MPAESTRTRRNREDHLRRKLRTGPRASASVNDANSSIAEPQTATQTVRSLPGPAGSTPRTISRPVSSAGRRAASKSESGMSAFEELDGNSPRTRDCQSGEFSGRTVKPFMPAFFRPTPADKIRHRVRIELVVVEPKDLVVEDPGQVWRIKSADAERGPERTVAAKRVIEKSARYSRVAEH